MCALFSQRGAGVTVCEDWWWGKHRHFGELGDGFGTGCCARAVEVEEQGKEAGHEGVEDVEVGKGGDGGGVEGEGAGLEVELEEGGVGFWGVEGDSLGV